MFILVPNARHRGPWAVLFLFVFLMSWPAMGQDFCGDPPKDVPTYIQEQLRGDAEGKAQGFAKFLGSAEVKGNVDASRTELYEQHKNLDQHQIDMYFLWVSCKAIMADQTLPTTEKMKLWLQVRSAFNSPTASAVEPARDPNALYQYNKIVAEVQGAVVSEGNGTITFQTVHTAGKANSAQELEYQDWVLMCPGIPAPAPNTIVGQFSGMAVGVMCHIIRKRAVS